MQNNNMTISLDMNRIFDLKGESSNLVSDFIQPIVDIKNTVNIIQAATLTSALSTTLFTTPLNKDFYLTAYHLRFIKDVTATTTLLSIQAFILGVKKIIALLPSFTLTVDTGVQTHSLFYPIKIDRGTAITIDSTTNVANFSASAMIQGYTVETTK